MAMGVGSPASHLDLDHLPLAERRRRLPPPPRAEPSRPAPDRLENDAAAKGASKGEIQQWPGLPRGAQFNPSDSDLLWHLAAEVGSRLACRHPFISEFIKTLDEDKGFGCTHPQDIPGVKPDGHASYFFRTTFMSYNNKNNINWQQVGTPRPIILDTSLQGCKEVFILYTCKTNDSSPQKTDWRLHQFYIGKSKRNEGELVLSKIFYKLNKNQYEWDGKAPAASAQDASVTDDNSEEEKQVEIFCANMTDGNHFVQDDRNNQEQRQTEKYPDQNEISSCKDILDATSFNHENLMNSHIQTDELDHVSLRERYRILLAEKHSSSDSFNVMVSAEKCGMDDFKNSCRQSHAEASRSIPKRESDEISHEGPLDRQDVFSVLQEVSAAPLIINTSGDDSRSQVEDLQDILVSPSESFVDGAAHQRASDYLDRSILNSTYTTPNLEMSETHLCVKTEESTDGIDSETSGAVQLTTDNVGLISTSGGSSPAAPSLHEARNCCDSLENSEHQEDDKVVSFGVDLPRSSVIPFGGNENIQLLSIKPSTLLVDVKLEPTLENDEIYPTESTLVNSHHSSENGGLKENDGVVPKCLPRDGEMDLELFHDKGNLIEKSLADCTCSKHSAVLKHVPESSNAVGSTSSFSSDNCNRISVVLSSEANTTSHKDPVPSLGMKSELTGSRSKFSGLCENNSVNIAEPFVKTAHNRNLSHDEDATYYSRQTKRRKTATDSIEKALEEDAPGLLQILLNRGILVEDIKLYGVEQDDEVLPDCREIDFEDLENIITKLFPHRSSLLKFSAARHVKGEKSIYCLACLISLIEQARYLQFRDCPVEWGWCRDLQSFIFVFKSHNRIVLERPEYGYATYFFEVVQSLPIEWQIRRLVTAMKLSSCGRTALLENKPLLVGEDLTEGEAQVLKEYGWLPNTGLGTMLNYCDRVVHNRWNEKYSSEWRVKIGKLLMNGYMGGQSVLTCIPEKVVKHVGYESTEIKLEDPL